MVGADSSTTTEQRHQESRMRVKQHQTSDMSVTPPLLNYMGQSNLNTEILYPREM